MTYLDFILNVACLLLWLGWRALRLSAHAQPRALSLASTLKRAEPKPVRSWTPLVWLGLLLLGRSVFYWQTGSSWRWVPTLECGAIVLPFPSDSWGRMLLFSGLSFLRVWLVFHVWLLLLTMVNRAPGAGAMQSLVSAQLGVVGRWPWPLQLVLVPAAGVLLWLVAHGPLVWLGLMASRPGEAAVWQQGLALSLAVCLSGKYPVVIALGAHFLNSYLYVGEVTWWNYAALSGRNLLRPLRWLPLAIGRLDLRPILGIVLVLVGAHYAGRGLTWLFAHPLF